MYKYFSIFPRFNNSKLSSTSDSFLSEQNWYPKSEDESWSSSCTARTHVKAQNQIPPARENTGKYSPEFRPKRFVRYQFYRNFFSFDWKSWEKQGRVHKKMPEETVTRLYFFVFSFYELEFLSHGRDLLPELARTSRDWACIEFRTVTADRKALLDALWALFSPCYPCRLWVHYF